MAMTLLTQPPNEEKAAMSQLPAQEQDSGGQVLEFTGLDLREEAGSGAYLECENVSTRSYPCLSPRKGRGSPMYSGVDDIYRFDGKTVFRIGTQLWYDADGESAACIGTVTDTRKSFAVVDSRLVIFPDALSLDLRTGGLKPLALDITLTGASVSDDRTISGTFPGGGGSITSNALSSYSAVELIIPYFDTADDARAGTNAKSFYTLHNGQDISSYNDLVNKYIVPCYSESTGYALRYGQLMSHRTTYSGEPNENGIYGKITSVEREEEGGYFFFTISAVLYDADGNLFAQTFRAGDVVKITGLVYTGTTNEVGDFYSRIWAVNSVSATSGSVTFSLGSLTGMSVPSSGNVRLNREIPNLDYICAASNRIWGVSNVTDNESVADDGSTAKHNSRVIFCSKMGDPSNWYYNQGVSMDSWSVAVASEGDFTGIVEWSDDVLCFKEREMIRITGSQPSSYTMYSFTVPGVEQGSGGSIAVIDEVVYYKNERGVYRYSGGTPSRISEQIADALDGEGNGGTDGRNYFLSVPGGLYVYDTWHGAWVRHDDAVGRFAWDGGDALMLTGGNVYRVDSVPSDGIEWSATLHPDYGTTKTSYYSTSLNMGYKYYKFVFLRGELLRDDSVAAPEPCVTVYAAMGANGFDKIGEQVGAGKFVLRMPVGRYREDRIQLKLTGTGDCVLRDIRYVYSTGSEWIQEDKGAMS